MPDNNNNNGFGLGPNNQDPNRRGSLMATIIWIVIPLLLIGSMFFSFNSNANKTRDEYYEVISYFDQGEVKQYSLNLSSGKLVYTLKGEKEARSYTVPNVELFVNDVHDSVHEYNKAHPDKPIKQNYIAGSSRSWMVEILPLLFSTLIMAAIIIWFMRRMNNNIMGDAQRGMGFGKARVKKGGEEQKTTFADVAGADEEKEELQEIVEFLKDPKKYDALGARIPKGVLMVGPPGTGKTLLARATAGEAGVPFFSISGSDFVEMFVGVGASRVRDLFRQAKEKAPCIVFIDEIDAVGRARAKNGGFTSNDERENTLNQLLTEMDGFGTNSGVIVLAATNRADILDQALMRAGRFDRQIHVELPELKEREEIFQVHLRGIKVDPDFNVEFMAKHTPGFSGADIANVCNEAALTAARRNHATVSQQDFLDAVDRIIGGLERKNNTIMSPAEKRTTAYHEAGHALVGWLLPYADPVFKVSIIPRGNALGLTWYLPEERKNWSRSVMMDRMCSLIGGRVAEEILNGEPSTGALNDLERMTGMAYSMVQYYGMSDKVGNLSFYDSTGARGYNLTKPYSEKTAELMDEEVKAIVQEVHDRTYRLIEEHKDGFMQMGALLLEKEVIFAEDIERILGPKVKPAEEEQPAPETEEHE